MVKEVICSSKLCPLQFMEHLDLQRRIDLRSPEDRILVMTLETVIYMELMLHEYMSNAMYEKMCLSLTFLYLHVYSQYWSWLSTVIYHKDNDSPKEFARRVFAPFSWLENVCSKRMNIERT